MSEFEPGRLVRVALAVQRLVAPNPSLLTGPGTNTYLLGDPPSAVIDPGPADETHVAAIVRSAPALALILATHTHPDHSPAAAALARLTGARVVGRAAPGDGRQDLTFSADIQPERDQRFQIVGAGALRAIDTPGHASNHVCYLLEQEGMLFSGDHILDGVTPVIIPPDGIMADYLESLRRLRRLPLRTIAPGHGRVLQEPHAVIDGIIAHREEREAKVLRALKRIGRGTLEQLLPYVYDDVRPELHALARFSLEAHLIKLEQSGLCARDDVAWHARISK
jgi:glyoxylase-like metal-dependent hydrolase (beta-lactamase superfamily II)